jgi:hypothetical protein
MSEGRHPLAELIPDVEVDGKVNYLLFTPEQVMPHGARVEISLDRGIPSLEGPILSFGNQILLSARTLVFSFN